MLTLFRLFLLVGDWHLQHGTTTRAAFRAVVGYRDYVGFRFPPLGWWRGVAFKARTGRDYLTAARKTAEDGTEALKLAEMERESFQTETDKLKKEGEATEAKLKGAE